MKRELDKIQRNLEDTKNNDIIRKKRIIMDQLSSDPDLADILNKKPLRPKNKFADPNNPTKDELALRKEIDEYNKKVSENQIFPYLRLNGLKSEVQNFVLFDISDDNSHSLYDVNRKRQSLVFMCLVHEDDMNTEYGINRADLLSYIIKDIFSYSNTMGKQIIYVSDIPSIVDDVYYCRTVTFIVYEPNAGQYGKDNKYDRIRV